MKLEQAERIGGELIELLRPSCVRICLAGSIRREKAEVGDIEIVAVPHYTDVATGKLFATDETRTSMLETMIQSLRKNNTLGDPPRKCDGPKHKKVIYEGAKIDLFIVTPPADWGNILAIRTGPAEFSHMLVTQRRLGGAMPEDRYQADGALWDLHGNKIPCENEGDFFAAIDVPHWDPPLRTLPTLCQYLAERRREAARHADVI